MGKSNLLSTGIMVFILGCGSLTGCATIVKGTTQNIPISTDPPGAEVTADGQLMGQSPIDITLARKRDHLVTISKEGYTQKSIAITKSTGGAVWGNILAGGLIGWGIDATSGAQYNLSPESISVQLEPIQEGAATAALVNPKSDFIKRLNDLDELKEKNKISDEEYSVMRTSLFKEYYPEMDSEIVGAPPAPSTNTGQATPSENPK